MNDIPSGFSILPSIPERKNSGIKATMMIIVAFSNRSSQSIDNRDPVIVQMEDEYKVLASTDDLKFYIEYGKYYVLVNNINMTNEQLIRNTLGISSDIEFEIIIPGALLREKGTDMINYYD